MKTEKESIKSMDPNPIKPTGMPLAVKILMLVTLLGIGGYYLYTKVIVKVPAQLPVTEVSPADKPLFYKGQVVVAKCKDFKEIGLYLESDISLNEYNTTLEAVANVPSTVLVIPNQEVTFRALSNQSGRLMIYECQVSKGVLMGKLIKKG